MEQLEEKLAALLYDEGAPALLASDPLFSSLRPEELEEAAREVRRMVLSRAQRGIGDLTTWYPETLAAWRSAHPEDATLDRLAAAFCASPASGEWQESLTAAPGISLEEAFFRFFTDAEIGDPMVREEEFLGALVRGLAVTPRARFRHPPAVRPAPGGCFAVSRGGTLHAALDGRYLRGPLPLLALRLLCGASPEAVGSSQEEVIVVQQALREMRLLP